jgi:ATP-dependent Lon protease
VEIGKRYLVPRAYSDTGVSPENVSFTDEGLTTVIEDYTHEAGVRNLEREINNICRKVARRLAENDKTRVVVGPNEIEQFLGPRRVFHEMASRMGQPGVAIGLAVTQQGGEILFVEASAVPGSGQLLLTGQLGDVMKESAMAAFNYLHANASALGIPETAFSKQNVHLHVPAGATPKDGPSAGITMAVSLASLLSGRPVKDYLAMTGEITLKGNVLQVGGIKDKVLAAHRSGICELILPVRCEPELKKDVPPEVLNAMYFHFVDHISQVLAVAFPEEKSQVAGGGAATVQGGAPAIPNAAATPESAGRAE